MRRLSVVLLLIVMLSLAVCTALVMKAVPHDPNRVYRPSPPKPSHPQPTRYERLLPRYLKYASVVAEERVKDNTRFYRQGLRYRRQREAKIRWRESQILRELRERAAKRQDGKLSFEGECPENMALVVTSDASARIFRALVKENHADPWVIVSGFPRRAMLLSDEWIKLVQELADKADKDSGLYRDTAITLYRAGVHREKYRPVLEKWSEEGDPVALNALFFNLDAETGQPVVVDNPKNRVLLKRFSGPRYPPDIRAECAYYAAETGDLKLAEALCTEIIATRYEGLGKPGEPNAERSPADERLFRGKHNVGIAGPGAMDILFYKVRTERAFKTIFELAEVYDNANRIGRSEIPSQWKGFEDFYPAEFDLEHASSLVYEIEHFEEIHSRRP